MLAIAIVLPFWCAMNRASSTVSTFSIATAACWRVSEAHSLPLARHLRRHVREHHKHPLGRSNIGGGICIDVYYPQSRLRSADGSGADAFLIPSLTPGGVFSIPMQSLMGFPSFWRIRHGAASSIAMARNWPLAAIGPRRCAPASGSPIEQATINFDAVTLFADFNQQKMQTCSGTTAQRCAYVSTNPTVCSCWSRDRPICRSHEVMREFGLVSRRDYFAS